MRRSAARKRILGALAVGDVGALDEDSRHGAVGVAQRLEDEVDVALLELAVLRHVCSRTGTALPMYGSPSAAHVVEQVDEALHLDFRQRVEHGPADHVAVTNQPVERGIGELEHVLGSAQHDHEARRLFEQLAELPAARLELAVGRLDRLAIDALGVAQRLARTLAVDEIARAHQQLALGKRLGDEVLRALLEQAMLELLVGLGRQQQDRAFRAARTPCAAPRSICSPLTPGIMMSETIRSGGSASARSRPCWPSNAQITS